LATLIISDQNYKCSKPKQNWSENNYQKQNNARWRRHFFLFFCTAIFTKPTVYVY